jgi:hypothetical protein
MFVKLFFLSERRACPDRDTAAVDPRWDFDGPLVGREVAPNYPPRTLTLYQLCRDRFVGHADPSVVNPARFDYVVSDPTAAAWPNVRFQNGSAPALIVDRAADFEPLDAASV